MDGMTLSIDTTIYLIVVWCAYLALDGRTVVMQAHHYCDNYLELVRAGQNSSWPRARAYAHPSLFAQYGRFGSSARSVEDLRHQKD